MAAQLICVEDHESNPQVVACEQWLLGVEPGHAPEMSAFQERKTTGYPQNILARQLLEFPAILQDWPYESVRDRN
jgi:hypothetical protein